MPVLSGRRAVVTGATSGVGLETAAALAAAGAEVVFVGRDRAKGEAAIAGLRGKASPELLRFEPCDLADPDSVRDLAERLIDAGGRLDILVNNAGIMAPPKREVSKEGIELQFQVNYLSHFALTGLLLPRLERSSAARVVSLSSGAAAIGEIDFGDLQSEHYQPFRAYARSKAAMLMFALALERKRRVQGWPIASFCAHPGWAQTGIMQPEAQGATLGKRLISLATPLLAQSAEKGALPILFAATAHAAEPGGYYAPDGPGEMRGSPQAARVPDFARDEAAQERLWAQSERLTGVSYG